MLKYRSKNHTYVFVDELGYYTELIFNSTDHSVDRRPLTPLEKKRENDENRREMLRKISKSKKW